MYGSVSAHMARTFELLRTRMGSLTAELRPLAESVLAREGEIDRVLERITRRRIDVIRSRVHGDYHLGQVLWTGEALDRKSVGVGRRGSVGVEYSGCRE